MSQNEIEAFFLNHNDPWYEKIQQAGSEKEAIDMASRVLREQNQPAFDPKDVKAVVRKIRL